MSLRAQRLDTDHFEAIKRIEHLEIITNLRRLNIRKALHRYACREREAGSLHATDTNCCIDE
jgi:hypothetical protein